LDTDVLTPEGRAALDRRVAAADATLRTYGQPGVAAADLLGGTGAAIGGAWQATTGVLGQANETSWRTGEAVLTGQAQWQGSMQGSPYQVRRNDGVLERVEPAVAGAAIPGRITEGVHDWRRGCPTPGRTR